MYILLHLLRPLQECQLASWQALLQTLFSASDRQSSEEFSSQAAKDIRTSNPHTIQISMRLSIMNVVYFRVTYPVPS